MSPGEHAALVTEAYLANAAAPPRASDIHDLLERAALEGRPVAYTNVTGDDWVMADPVDHEPVPPTMRCQVCGRRIFLSPSLEDSIRDVDAIRWIHDPDDDGR